MFAALALIAFQAAPVAAPTLDQVRALPPARAGTLALAGRDHAAIVRIDESINRALMPPGWEELDMIEVAVRRGPLCERRRWRIRFQRAVEAAPGTARVTDAFPGREIARPVRGGCPAGDYTGLNTRTDAATAGAALARLDRLRATPGALACTGGPCDPPSVARLLARIPWMATRRDGAIELWFERGGKLILADDGTARIDQSPAPPA